MNTRIFQATTEDAEAIATLVNSAYRGEGSKKGWTTEADLLDGTRTNAGAIKELIQRKGTVVLKCERNQEIIACVELAVSGNEMYLGMLTVKPDLQGAGVGKQLLFAAEEEARKQNCVKLTMTVITVRTELIAWYKRHGYIDTGKKKPFQFDDPRFGIPKQPLEFVVLEKTII